MPANCLPALTDPRVRYYRWMFLTAAGWNALAAAAVLMLLTNAKFRMAWGISSPTDPPTLHLLASCLFLFGLGYYWVSRDLANNRDLVKLGVIGRVLVFLLLFGHAVAGNIPVILAIPSIVDLFYALLFLEFLVHRGRKAP